MQDNTKRSFDRLVSVDSWHTCLNEAESSDFFVEATFGKARLGGNRDSKVNFTLQLKRATVVIILPHGGTAGIDKASVDRGEIEEFDRAFEQSNEKKYGSELSLLASIREFLPRMSLSRKAERRESQKISTDGRVRGAQHVHYLSSEGHNCWKIEPRIGEVLNGRIWDAKVEPRLRVIDKRGGKQKQSDIKNGTPPRITVAVRCLREDLVVDNIEVVDRTRDVDLIGHRQHPKRLAAAESYIRDTLVKEKLVFQELTNPYAELTLVDEFAQAMGMLHGK